MVDLVSGEGRLDSKLFAIGRDPGEQEVRDGRPFVGAAGHILDKAMTSAGLRREDAYVDNICGVRPQGNDWQRHDPVDVAVGIASLREKIMTHKPALVVALGNEAFRVVMGVTPDDNTTLPGIQEARGYLWDSPLGVRVLASIHPTAAAREWVPWRVLLDVDWRKAAAELRLGCPPLPTRRVNVVTSKREAIDAVQALLKAPLLAVDIENHADMRLACCGFAANANEATVFPASEPWQRDAIGALCESLTPKALQNGSYDRYFLAKYAGIGLRAHVFDTMLAWHVLQPELAGQAQNKRSKRTAKSLRFLASIYTREPYWKSYDFASEDERCTLNGRDCCVTLEIAQAMERELCSVA